MSRLVLLLALAGIATASAQQGGGDHQLFQNVCKALGPFVAMPDIRTEQFCSSSGLDSNPRKCGLLDATEAALIKLYDLMGSSCGESQQTAVNPTSPSGAALPFPLSDQRPLPASLPASLWTSEGASMYWMWKNLFNFNKWAGCAATNTPREVTPGTPGGWLVPAGWTAHSTLWQAGGSEKSGMFWPFATIIYKGGEVAILIRGSQTEQDWKTDFNYRTDSASLQPGSIAFPGKVHQGFAGVAASLWGGVAAALQELIRAKGKIDNVYVAGHSLGAGVATLVSYGAQEYLKQQGQAAKVDALLFAPPNAGDSVFAAAFGQAVNARRMPFLHDAVPQVPCSPSMVACPRASVPTGRGLWSYSSVPGSLLIYPSAMPQQAEAWGLFSKIYPCQIGRFFAATHVCAYDCFLSQHGADNNNSCKLWQDDASSGTYCGNKVFPVTDGRPYPYKGL